MSSYIDHYRPPVEGEMRWQIGLSWADYTARRLFWLYGAGRAETPQSLEDVRRWNALGRRAAA